MKYILMFSFLMTHARVNHLSSFLKPYILPLKTCLYITHIYIYQHLIIFMKCG
jgi:hypothetical protein